MYIIDSYTIINSSFLCSHVPHMDMRMMICHVICCIIYHILECSWNFITPQTHTHHQWIWPYTWKGTIIQVLSSIHQHRQQFCCIYYHYWYPSNSTFSYVWLLFNHMIMPITAWNSNNMSMLTQGSIGLPSDQM